MSIDPLLDPALSASTLEASIASSDAMAVEVTLRAAQTTESGHVERAGLARATSLLAVGTVASRFFGFAQELLMAHFFGTKGGLVDAFQIAITIPRDLYDLAISGHVNSALVPVLSEYAERDREALWQLLNNLLGLIIVILSGITLLLEIFAEPVVEIYRGILNPDAMALTVSLLRITTPALLALGIFAITSGTLYALRRFSAPAFGSALFNGTVVGALVLLAPLIGIERAAIGWVLGAVVQMALQFTGLRTAFKRPLRPNFNLRVALKQPGVRRIGKLYAPVALSLVFDVLINRTFSYHLASQTGSGNIAYMNWATSLREFPMGLVGTAISIAILPTLARQALDKEQRQAFVDTLGQGIRLVLTLILPATIGLFVLAGPLIGLMFENGAFTATNTTITALVLRLYLLGIPFAAVDLLLIFAFYANKDTLTPALIGVVSLVCYMLITLGLQSQYGFYALMIADSVKFLIHTGLSFYILSRRIGGMRSQRLLRTLLKTGFATVLTGLAAYGVLHGLTTLFDTDLTRESAPVTLRFLLVFAPSAAGGFVYVALVYVMRIREFTWFIDLIRQRATKH